MGNSIKKTITKSLFNAVPLAAQIQLARTQVHLPEAKELPEGLKICLAETPDQFKKAFQLIYKHYLKLGLIKPNEEAIHFLAQHLFPTTSLIVAMDGDSVIATVSLIRKNPVGFPAEKMFSFSTEELGYQHYAEVTCLVIEEKYRRSNESNVIFPLLKFMYQYCVEYFSVENLFAVINPKDQHFYQGLLLFKPAELGTIIHMNSPLVLMKLNLAQAKFDFEDLYGNKEPRRNLFHFFTKLKLPQLLFPKRDKFFGLDPWILRPQFTELFHHLTRVLLQKNSNQLSDLRALKIHYTPTSQSKAFEGLPIRSNERRSHYRYPQTFHGICVDGNKNRHELIILDISLHGIRGYFKDGYNPMIGDRFRIAFKIDKSQSESNCQVTWIREGQIGFRVEDRTEAYENLISILNLFFFSKEFYHFEKENAS